jgi:hypothetical protein
MLNYIKAISLASLFLFLSCNSKQSLEKDDLVLSVYSKEEAHDLKKIRDFFTDQICEKTRLENSNPIECYDKFMKDMKKSGSTGTYTYIISSDDIDEMFKSLESEVSNEIWNRDTFTNEFGVTHEFLDLNLYKNTYSDFLGLVGENDQAIKEYHEDLLSAGTISATTVAIMLMFPEKYNTTDEKVQLIIAVHYITCFYQHVIEAPE